MTKYTDLVTNVNLIGNIFRTFAAFEQHLSKGILLDATTYIIPIEICSMVNVVLDAKTQALKLCGVDGVDMVSDHFYLYYSKLERRDKQRALLKQFQDKTTKSDEKDKKVSLFLH